MKIYGGAMSLRYYFNSLTAADFVVDVEKLLNCLYFFIENYNKFLSFCFFFRNFTSIKKKKILTPKTLHTCLLAIVLKKSKVISLKQRIRQFFFLIQRKTLENLIFLNNHKIFNIHVCLGKNPYAFNLQLKKRRLQRRTLLTASFT